MKFDDVLRVVGQFGPYQKKVYFFAVLPVVFSAFEAYSVVFTFNIPPHRCAIPGYPDDQYHVINDSHAFFINASIPRDKDKGNQWSQCRVFSDVTYGTILASFNDSRAANTSTVSRGSANTTTCERWVFDHSIFQSTIATDFNTVCDRSVLRVTSNVFVEAGSVVGTLASGFLADRFGRKIPFYVGGIALVAGGFGIAFTTNLLALNICRFIIGIARMALWVNGLVIGMEIVGPAKRVFAGTVIELVWCLGMLILIIFTYLLRHWRYLEIALSVPSISLLAYWWMLSQHISKPFALHHNNQALHRRVIPDRCLKAHAQSPCVGEVLKILPESPRWLASKGRDKEALQILEKIAQSNKTKLPEVDDVKDLLEAEKSLSFRYIFTSRNLIISMLIVFSNMFILVVMYYALMYNITNLAGDLFVNYLINGIMEAMGLFGPYLFLDRLGRKMVFCTSMFLGGAACVACLLPALLNAPDWVIIALAIGCRFFVCSAFSTLYVYGAELFPTIIRGSAMGVGVTFSRLGGIISPYLADLGLLFGGSLEKALPLVVMGTPALLVAVFALWLPETRGARLPETMNDIHLLYSKRRCPCGGGADQENDAYEREVTPDGDVKAVAASPC